MTISFVAAGSQANAPGGVGPITPGLPAGIASGDCLLCLPYAPYSIGAANRIVTPSGYDDLDNHNSQSSAIFQKMAGGSESAPNIAFSDSTATFNDELAMMLAFRGTKTIATLADLDNEVYAEYGPIANTAAGATYPAMNVNSNGCAIVLVVLSANLFTATSAPDGTWTKVGDFTTGGSNYNGTTMGIYYKIQTVAANIPSGSVGLTGAQTSFFTAAYIFSIPAPPGPTSDAIFYQRRTVIVDESPTFIN